MFYNQTIVPKLSLETYSSKFTYLNILFFSINNFERIKIKTRTITIYNYIFFSVILFKEK